MSEKNEVKIKIYIMGRDGLIHQEIHVKASERIEIDHV